MKKHFLLFACLVWGFQTFSQEQDEPEKYKLKLIGFSGSIGNLTYTPDNTTSQETFQKLAPNKKLSFRDISEFEQNGLTSINSFGPTLDLSAHFSKRKDDGTLRKLNPEYKLGFSFNTIELFNSYYSRKERIRIDTLTSSRTGENLFIDSIISESYNYS